MTTNGVASDADMAECDGEKVVTMMDVLQEQQDFEDDANAVLGASDEKNCTYSKGYIKRQAIYACLTCCADAKDDPTKRAGVCLACSLNCHENHELIELYTKRNFRCDCGNPKFNSHPCQFTPSKTDLNVENKYNQNFAGLYCNCHRPYPDPEATYEHEMIQCIICEDWLHANHLDATVPNSDQYYEMICKECMGQNEFLHDYSELTVISEPAEVDVTTVYGPEIKIVNGSTELPGDEISTTDQESADIIRAIDDMDVDTSAMQNIEVTDVKTLENDEIIDKQPSEESFSENKIESSDVPMKSQTKDIEDVKSQDINEESKLEDTLLNEESNLEESIEMATSNGIKATDPSEQLNETKAKTTDNSIEPTSTTITESNLEISETVSEPNVEDAKGLEEGKTQETISEINSDGKVSNSSVVETSNVDKQSDLSKNTEPAQAESQPNNETNPETDNNSEQAIENATEQKDDNTSDTNNVSNSLEPSNSTKEEEKYGPEEENDSSSKPEVVNENSEVSLQDSINNIAEVIAKDPENDTPSNIDNTSEKPAIDTNLGIQETENKTVDDCTDPAQVESLANTEKNIVNGNTGEVPNSISSETGTQDNKRKLSTEEAQEDSIPKKTKIDSCTRPRGVKRVHQGATFWPSNFRQKLCTCSECITMYKDLSVLYLIDSGDTVTAYETLGKEKIDGKPTTQYEKGLQALSSLDRIQQINALTEYNKMRDKLLDFLKSFKDRQEVVKEEDIKAFFADMKPRREPDGVYFCR